jgi:hypothetical protein
MRKGMASGGPGRTHFAYEPLTLADGTVLAAELEGAGE